MTDPKPTLAILGATGRTGRLLVQAALDAGYPVRALARRPDSLGLSHARLAVVQGDARQAADVQQLVQGAGAVLSALGPVKGDGAGVMTLAGQHLVAALPAAGITRLVTLTGAGVHQPGDQPNLVDKIIRRLLRTLQADVLRDSEGHVAAITASALDWTVVRAPLLVDGPAAPVTAAMVGGIKPRVTRASVAAFMLAELEERRWVRKSPAVSN